MIQPQTQAQQPYDVPADYVDSTTAYEPKQGGFLDADFIGHGKSLFKSKNIATITISIFSRTFFQTFFPEAYFHSGIFSQWNIF